MKDIIASYLSVFSAQETYNLHFCHRKVYNTIDDRNVYKLFDSKGTLVSEGIEDITEKPFGDFVYSFLHSLEIDTKQLDREFSYFTLIYNYLCSSSDEYRRQILVKWMYIYGLQEDFIKEVHNLSNAEIKEFTRNIQDSQKLSDDFKLLICSIFQKMESNTDLEYLNVHELSVYDIVGLISESLEQPNDNFLNLKCQYIINSISCFFLIEFQEIDKLMSKDFYKKNQNTIDVFLNTLVRHSYNDIVSRKKITSSLYKFIEQSPNAKWAVFTNHWSKYEIDETQLVIR